MRGHGFKFHVWPRKPRGTLIASHGCIGSWTWIATPNMKFEDMTPGCEPLGRSLKRCPLYPHGVFRRLHTPYLKQFGHGPLNSVGGSADRCREPPIATEDRRSLPPRRRTGIRILRTRRNLHNHRECCNSRWSSLDE
jgi:hypothetical protein